LSFCFPGRCRYAATRARQAVKRSDALLGVLAQLEARDRGMA
jgi:hypothetical protein